VPYCSSAFPVFQVVNDAGGRIIILITWIHNGLVTEDCEDCFESQATVGFSRVPTVFFFLGDLRGTRTGWSRVRSTGPLSFKARVLKHLLVSEAKRIRLANANGIRKMIRNILALQQSIKTLTSDTRGADFDRAKKYYTLFFRTPTVCAILKRKHLELCPLSRFHQSQARVRVRGVPCHAQADVWSGPGRMGCMSLSCSSWRWSR